MDEQARTLALMNRRLTLLEHVYEHVVTLLNAETAGDPLGVQLRELRSAALDLEANRDSH